MGLTEPTRQQVLQVQSVLMVLMETALPEETIMQVQEWLRSLRMTD